MEQQLRDHVERLFERAPHTRSSVELKEEVLQNLMEKYNDLLQEGKSPEAAYNISVAGIGEMDNLIADLWNRESRREQPSQQELEGAKTRSALLTAVGVMCIILSVTPILMGGNHAVVWMFVMIAIGVGLLIFNNMTRPGYVDDDDMVGDFRTWQHQGSEQRQLLKSVRSAVWAVAVALYFFISFNTFAWHVTWVVFPLAAAISSLIAAVLDLRRE